MIICENEPAELPRDVVRSDTKVDDGIDRLNLNLNNILEKFERGARDDESQPSSASIIIEKPSFDIKKTLMAFETNNIASEGTENVERSQISPERRVVKKLVNLGGFFKQDSLDSDSPKENVEQTKPLPVRRSESLMMRLKKYESRISGGQSTDLDSSDESETEGSKSGSANRRPDGFFSKTGVAPKKITSLKNQWENGDISKRRLEDESAHDPKNASQNSQNSITPSSPNKDHFQLNLSNKANKLKERFEQGLINNSSIEDSDDINDNEPELTKMEQLRREKLEDLSIFKEGEIKAREARSLFQQIDRRLSAENNRSRFGKDCLSRSPAAMSTSMSSK